MQDKNTRITVVGIVLLIAAIAFYLFMLVISSKSNDPATMMTTVGTVSGVVGGLAIAMTIAGLIGKKR